jgi:uncharacterized protein (TIGR00369 family)
MAAPRTDDELEALRAHLNALPLCGALDLRCTRLSHGGAVVEQTTPSSVRHPDGTIPGVFLTPLADAAASFALHTVASDDELLRTIDLTVHFIRAARTPSVYADAEVVRRSRRVAFVRTSIHDADAQVCALATGSWSIAPAPASPPSTGITAPVM